MMLVLEAAIREHDRRLSRVPGGEQRQAIARHGRVPVTPQIERDLAQRVGPLLGVADLDVEVDESPGAIKQPERAVVDRQGTLERVARGLREVFGHGRDRLADLLLQRVFAEHWGDGVARLGGREAAHGALHQPERAETLVDQTLAGRAVGELGGHAEGLDRARTGLELGDQGAAEAFVGERDALALVLSARS